MTELSFGSSSLSFSTLSPLSLYINKDETDVLTKSDLTRWLDNNTFDKSVVWWKTSGTTGLPANIAFPEDYHKILIERYYREILGVEIDDLMYLHLASPSLRPKGIVLEDDIEARKLKNNEYFLSPPRSCEQWSEEDLKRIYRELHDLKPDILRVDPFYLLRFIVWAEEFGLTVPKIDVVVCSYSLLMKNTALRIQSFFNCKVYELYGMSEVGPVWLREYGSNKKPTYSDIYLELRPIESYGSCYEVLVTTSRNTLYNLYRYQSNDVVKVKGSDIEFIGRRFHGFAFDNGTTYKELINDLESNYKNILCSQIEINDNRYLLKLVVSGKLIRGKSILRFLKKKTGLDFEISIVDWLTPESSGKFSIIS
ncbi:phenylacetate--CoA ligase family protein [Enterovibrio coralii]|uniref:AMP-dependent synthetase/ligase domain-containing protein n=1 Tax=Enterovibrio coralii TaxID=294935 RepID=A0A135I4Z7_9GAMM|nr:hypothetical protein [Enterovibrio coralii]KXF80526.1 hypothetical protein ATN88_07520 [Enterovibrio coralii]